MNGASPCLGLIRARRDCADAANGDLVFQHPPDRTDLLEPFDLDPVRQLDDLRPTVEQILEATLPPARVPNMGVPVLIGARVDTIGNIRRGRARFLQQGHVRVHRHQLAPRFLPPVDVPTDDSHSRLRLTI